MSQYYKPNRTRNLYNAESDKPFRLNRSGTEEPDELLSARDESAKDILKEIGPISKKDYKHYRQL